MSAIMKIRMIMAAAGASVLLLSGTATAAATAYPIEDASVLTNNDLYGAGKLPAAGCAQRPPKGKTMASVSKHVKAIVACLETTWGSYLKEANLPYVPVQFEFQGRIKDPCHHEARYPKSDVSYCGGRAWFDVQIRPDWLKSSSDLDIFAKLSAAYGHHVMNMVDIAEGYAALRYDTNVEAAEQYRRYGMQAKCLAGVSAKSVWSTLGYSSKDLGRMLDLMKVDADTEGKNSLYGKGSTIVSWAKRGYASGNPKSCNTWIASSGKVL
jgi:uncharacterized protein